MTKGISWASPFPRCPLCGGRRLRLRYRFVTPNGEPRLIRRRLRVAGRWSLSSHHRAGVVEIVQRNPSGSRTRKMRGPQGVSVGSVSRTAPWCLARAVSASAEAEAA
jgi:hypothetical protein